MKLGAAKAEAGRVWSLVEIILPKAPPSQRARQQRSAPFEFALKKDKLREVFKREGRYVLRTNLPEKDPAKVWEFYLQLVEVEEAFKNLKGDLAFVRFSISWNDASRRISSFVFWLTAFMSPCAINCGPKRLD